jgi:hypothetical protein
MEVEAASGDDSPDETKVAVLDGVLQCTVRLHLLKESHMIGELI